MVLHPDSPSAARQDRHGVASFIVLEASRRINSAGLFAPSQAEQISFSDISYRCWPATCQTRLKFARVTRSACTKVARFRSGIHS